MLGESIKRKKEELQNMITINYKKYQSSPFQTMVMKSKPKIIYPKHEQDHAFLYSEGSKGTVNVYNCSHSYMYGNLQNKEQLSVSERSQKSDLSMMTAN